MTFYSNLSKSTTINKLRFPGIDHEFTFNHDDFHFLDVISAKLHIIRHCLYKPANLYMVVKIINIQRNPILIDEESEEKFKSLLREVANFSQISRKMKSSMESNVVDFYGFCLHEGEAWICMEYMDMTLYSFYLK